MRKLFLLLTALAALVCILTAAWAYRSPAKTVSRMLDSLAAGKLAKAETYTSGGSLNIDLKNRSAKQFYTLMFSSISYTVTASSIEGDAAKVTVSVTMIDMLTLFSDASVEQLDRSFANRWSEGSYYRALIDKMKAGDTGYEVYTVTVNLVKSGKDWKVDMGNSAGFAYAITGGAGGLLGY